MRHNNCLFPYPTDAGYLLLCACSPMAVETGYGVIEDDDLLLQASVII